MNELKEGSRVLYIGPGRARGRSRELQLEDNGGAEAGYATGATTATTPQ